MAIIVAPTTFNTNTNKVKLVGGMGSIREFVARLYFTSPRARSILRGLGVRSEFEKELPQLCSIEYFWVLKNLDLDRGRILDVGSVGSTLPFKLACLGYEVYSIDVQELLQLKIVRLPNLKFIRGDIRHTNFPTISSIG